MARRALTLGIHGSANKSVAILADETGVVLTRREGASLNGSGLGFDNVARILYVLITRCCEDARCTSDDLAGLVVGIGGVERQEDSARLCETVNGLFSKNGKKPLPMTVEPDWRAVLEGAFDGSDGVVILAGADTIVVGKTPRGQVVRVGGWGRLLGDEGGGFYIGREALVALTQECERRGTSGRLRDVLCQKFKFDTREHILSAIYQEKFDIASLAPVVIDTAANNDVVAQRILDRAAALLADQARIVVMQMGLLRKVRLVMAGSLVDHETVYANTLHMKLLKVLPQVEIRVPLHEPAYGAVLLALARLQKA